MLNKNIFNTIILISFLFFMQPQQSTNVQQRTACFAGWYYQMQRRTATNTPSLRHLMSAIAVTVTTHASWFQISVRAYDSITWKSDKTQKLQQQPLDDLEEVVGWLERLMVSGMKTSASEVSWWSAIWAASKNATSTLIPSLALVSK